MSTVTGRQAPQRLPDSSRLDLPYPQRAVQLHKHQKYMCQKAGPQRTGAKNARSFKYDDSSRFGSAMARRQLHPSRRKLAPSALLPKTLPCTSLRWCQRGSGLIGAAHGSSNRSDHNQTAHLHRTCVFCKTSSHKLPCPFHTPRVASRSAGVR